MPVERSRYVPRRRQEGGDDNPLGVPDLEDYVVPGQDIGVPPEYSTTVDISSYSDIFGTPGAAGTRGRPGTVSRRPIYQDGDELLPANYGPERIADLQRQLAEIGLLPEGARIRYKVWDEATAGAFYKLLAYANQNGLHWATALNKLKSESEGGFTVDEFGNLVPAGQEAEELLPTRTTPAEELEPVFRQVAIDVLGVGMDQGQIDQMVQAYQQQEIERQREAYAAEGTERNVTGMPSPEAFAAAQAEESNPDRAGAERGLQYANLFEQVLGNWQGAGMGTL